MKKTQSPIKAASKQKATAQQKNTPAPAFCAWDGDTLIVNILGKPGAKQNAIGKVKGSQLKISVTASPVDGKATDHMVKFLANEFGVSSSAIAVVFGQFNINKQLRIKSPAKLPSIIAEALKSVT